MRKAPFLGVLNIQRGEWRLSLLMCGYFFLVITSFWILKPLKKGLFIRYYDREGFDLLLWHFRAAQAEQLAKVLNIAVAFAAAFLFTLLARRFRRQQLTHIASLFFLGCYLLFIQVIGRPSGGTVWAFYLFGDLFSTVMVSTFFAFLNDSVTPAQARRLYGLIGLGGVAGGAFGSLVVFSWIDQLSIRGWLWVAMGIVVAIALMAQAAGWIVAARGSAADFQPAAPEPPKAVAQAAFEGGQLVLKSRYLLAILGIVGLYEMVSTIMDFQFSATISHFLDNSAIDRQFATIYVLTNIVAMIVQLFVTSPVMTHLGMTSALMFLPVAVLVGSIGFLVAPVLWMGSLLNTADGGFSYSIHQSAREALYVPTSREEKYKAKAFIDMFVQRLAKAAAVALGLVITAFFSDFHTMRWLSVITAVLVVFWVTIVRFAGRCFGEMTQQRTARGDDPLREVEDHSQRHSNSVVS
ncbi:MAG: hypothetical protein JW797_10160 [Bradymonadales bacterium]|nr:hypothetical protein [Bradymonadales bacterium]